MGSKTDYGWSMALKRVNNRKLLLCALLLSYHDIWFAKYTLFELNFSPKCVINNEETEECTQKVTQRKNVGVSYFHYAML